MSQFTVSVDHELCQSHGMCADMAPEVFALRDEDDRSVPLAVAFDARLRADAEYAAGTCPEMAITVADA